MTAPRFVTLGPAGTNHAFVTLKYLAFHRLSGPPALCGTVDEAIDQVRCHAADHAVVCAVHPQAARAVGRFYREVFVVDTFISPSLPLAVVARRDVARPRSLGLLHPSTSDYVDTSAWEHVERLATGTLHDVAAGLLAGRYDAGLVYQSYADRYPDLLRVVTPLGSPDDAWLVFGRERTFIEPVLAWKGGPLGLRLARSTRGDEGWRPGG